MNPLLIGPIGKILDKTLDRVLPDRDAREKAKAEMIKLSSEIDLKEIKDFQDFMIGYEGKGDQVHWSIQILRGSVRPIMTYFLAAAYVWGFLHPAEFNLEQMQGLFQLNLISLGFWYGERALKNLGLNLGKKEVK